MLQPRGARINYRFPCFQVCWRWGGSLFLIWSKGRGVSRGQAGNVTYVVCPPLSGGIWFQGACTVPCFCSQHAVFCFWPFRSGRRGFLVFLYFCPEFIPVAPSVPYSFSIFCSWRRGLSRCMHCSKGSQVPAQPISALLWTYLLRQII